MANDSHVVTVTEAAYSSLFAILRPKKGWWYGQAADWPPLEEQEWLIESASAAIHSAAGEEYQGRVIGFFGALPYGSGVVQLPANEMYTWGQRARLLRPVSTLYGMGFWFRTPALIATDVIDLNIGYRVVFP